MFYVRFQVGPNYLEGDTSSPVLAEFLGVPQEKENASCKIKLNSQQPEPSFAIPF